MRNILIAFIVTMFLACSSHASTSLPAPVVTSEQATIWGLQENEDPFFLVREDFCEVDGEINRSTDICPIVSCPVRAPIPVKVYLGRQVRVGMGFPTHGTIFVCIGPLT